MVYNVMWGSFYFDKMIKIIYESIKLYFDITASLCGRVHTGVSKPNSRTFPGPNPNFPGHLNRNFSKETALLSSIKRLLDYSC